MKIKKKMEAKRKSFSAVWIFIVGVCFLWTALTVFAMDPEGCLTCHQYPGLVVMNPNAGVKILHINETRYLKSSHGRFACKKCHSTIVMVPHTGKTRVQCSTECHLNAKEKRLVDNTPLSNFHRQEQSAIASLQDESSCRVCHLLYPHSENNMVRAFLNMHTGFMICEVCHLNRENYPTCFFDWNGIEKVQFSGEPYGTFYNPHLKRNGKLKNFLSRIGVFVTVAGEKRSLMNTWDTAKAKAFIRNENNMTPGDKKERLAYFHRDIKKKEISVACDECHSTHSILDFQKLGFDQKTKNNLVYLNIKGLVTKYETFYFPELFE